MGKHSARGARENGGGGARGGRGEVATASGLITHSTSLVSRGEIDAAERAATKAVKILDAPTSPAAAGPETQTLLLTALTLLGEISVEKGDTHAAVVWFEKAVALDPDGTTPEIGGGGAEKFLWLAQLSEQGGEESVRWYDRGVEVLRRGIGRSVDGDGNMEIAEEDGRTNQETAGLHEKRRKLASALCSIIEVYMTDLSWSPDAESICENHITEALMIAPSLPEPLQTLASIRISQSRLDEARRALQDSMTLWKNAFDDDGDEDEDEDEDEDGQTTKDFSTADESKAAIVPDFPTRISLARLLMEVGLAEDAVEVVERLVGEDDHSVEAWYLGGWGLYLLGTTDEPGRGDPEVANGHEENEQEKQRMARISSREWLRQSLKLYDILDYEDDRLKEHAGELIEELDKILGPSEEGDQDEEGDEWESDGSLEEGEDDDMKDV